MRILLTIILSLFFVSNINAHEFYKAKVVDLYDADTFTLAVDIGFDLTITDNVRLFGLDTPELRTRNSCEKKLGYEAKDYTKDLIFGKTFDVEFHGKGKFGRYLVNLILPDGETLTEHLIEKEFAYAYFGEKKKVWFSDCTD